MGSNQLQAGRQTALPPTLPPRLICRGAAADYVAVSPNTFDRMIKEGRMPTPRQLTDCRVAWDVRELDVAVDRLPKKGETESPADDDGWDD